MKRIPITSLAFAVSLVPWASAAEKWELGGAIAYSFPRNPTIARDAATAKAGLERSPAVSFYASHRERSWFSGDFYYTYRPGDLKLTSGSTTVNFDSDSHLIHYDIVIHPTHDLEARFDPYFSAGGGMRLFRGLGREAAFQGLNNFAVLSRTQEITPLLSVAAGARYKLSKHAAIRFEFRDNISSFPGKVIFVNRQATAPKWFHDFSPQVGFGVTF